MEDGRLDNELTFEDILKIFRKRFWWFFLTVVVTVAIALIYLFTTTPIYEASTTLKVGSSQQSSVVDIFGSQMSSGSSKISTEIELIKSRRNLEKVVDNLHLVDYFKERSDNPENVTKNGVIKYLGDIITVSPVKDTNIVKISVQSEDSELARSVADELAIVYNDLLKSLSQNEYTSRRKFIEEQIPKAESELNTAQDNLRLFKEENNVFILDEEAKKYMGKFEIISTIKDSKEDLTVKKARQIYFKIQEIDKINLLIRLIDLDDDFYALVFTNTKVQSEEVANRLIENGYEAEVLNGDVSQYQRERILNKFKDKKTKILIATDVAARGIDIDNLKYVINYSLPQNPENYIHRIGRTARAGNEGTAITFVTPREFRKFLFIKNSVGSDIKEAKIPNISDIINSKIDRIKGDIVASSSENVEKIYKLLAQRILEESEEDPETIISSILKYFLKDTLNTKKYEEIRKVERNTTFKNTRLFVALGNSDNISPKKLAEFIEKETGISKKNIRNIQVLEKFSFVSVPFEESQVILETFKRKSKGRKPLVAEAKNQGK
jgi:capsular polysaccharide biosynthesis protein